MSLKMPEADPETLARKGEIIAALRALVPAENVIDDPDGLRVYESDGLTAYRELPLAVCLPEKRRAPQDSRRR